MLRILLVVSLLMVVGAHKHDPWKYNMKRFFEVLSRDINLALRESLGMFPDKPTGGSYMPSSTERPTSGSYTTESTTTTPTSKPTSGSYTTKSTTTTTPTSRPYTTKSTTTTTPTSRPYTTKSTTTTTTPTSRPYTTKSTTTTTTSPTSRSYTTKSTTTTTTPTSRPTVSTTEDCDPHESSTTPSTHGHPLQIGSIRGVPGVHFPEYKDIPVTSFTCADKQYVPGFYADMETGCQVFHVCWPHRRESFLCPVGTTFNQALMTCDFWYSSNCSLAHYYYHVNAEPVPVDASNLKGVNVGSMINVLLASGKTESSTVKSKGFHNVALSNPNDLASFISQFLPVKAKVIVYSEAMNYSRIASASIEESGHWKEFTGKYPTHKKTVVPTEGSRHHSGVTGASVPPLSTVSPDTSNKRYKNLEEAVARILDKVSEMVQIIIREAKYTDQKSNSNVHSTGYKPLTELNPRFITKPVILPTNKSVKSSISGASKGPVTDIPKGPINLKDQHSGSAVSAKTKEALTVYYLRFLKMKTD